MKYVVTVQNKKSGPVKYTMRGRSTVPLVIPQNNELAYGESLIKGSFNTFRDLFCTTAA
jgi:hypothetical protein